MNRNTHKPFFLFLLPAFFVLHGYRENYDFVSVKDASILTGIYLAATVILLLLFRVFFKNWQKAAIATFLVMAFHFFFGSIYDGLKSINENAFFTKYSFILPAVAVLFLLIIIYIKKRNPPSLRLSLYLNTLFAILLAIDGVMLVNKHLSLKNEKKTSLKKEFSPRDTLANPDIYFIILDEYGGLRQLKDQFGFDNSAFETELTKRQFHIVRNSSSNYLSTPLSIASFLSMNYLDVKGINQEQDRVLLSYDKIRQSILLRYLISQGYDFYNFSIFDFPGQKTFIRPTFLPTGKKLITSQTFLSRVKENIGYHLYTTLGFNVNVEKYIYIDLENNNSLYDRTFKLASTRSPKPRFIYTHLTMPHYPYYFTKEGKQRPLKELLVKNKPNAGYYLEYLGYCSNKALTLLDEIRKSSPGAIIIAASDHGFRASEIEFDNRYLFYNLCTVYLPSQNYSKFYDGLSGVNLFRTLLNSEFQQHLPLLKDSCVQKFE